MRIGLTFNLKPPGATGDQYEEFDSEETIAGLERAIRSHAHETVRLGWGGEMLDRLADERVDGVFNIAEGMGGRGRESQVPAVLEMLGIPCSGAPPLAIGLTLDKALAKMVAQANGIATAPFQVIQPRRSTDTDGGQAILPVLPLPGALKFPLFAKPAGEGSSMGITASSRCENRSDLDEAIARLSRYGPILIEEYLPGEEYTVGVIDGEVLAVMQVVPRTKEEHFVYSLEVKRDYLNRVEYGLVDDEDVQEVALHVWRAFGLRDVSRIDVRRDHKGVPCFIEVNPLPGVHPVNSDLVIMARLAGISYEELMGRVIGSATRRWTACAS